MYLWTPDSSEGESKALGQVLVDITALRRGCTTAWERDLEGVFDGVAQGK